MNEENKVKFPEVCPVCGGKERLLANTIAQLKAEDKLSKDAFANGVALQVPLIDPTRITRIVSPTIKICSLIIFYDICANPECGAFYVTGIQVVEQPAQVQMRGGPPGPQMNFKGGRPTPN